MKTQDLPEKSFLLLGSADSVGRFAWMRTSFLHLMVEIENSLNGGLTTLYSNLSQSEKIEFKSFLLFVQSYC